MFEHYFKTNEEAGSLYSVEDLLKVKLVSDDHIVGPSKLKFDLEVFDRGKEGDEKRTYEYLVKQGAAD